MIGQFRRLQTVTSKNPGVEISAPGQALHLSYGTHDGDRYGRQNHVLSLSLSLSLSHSLCVYTHNS